MATKELAIKCAAAGRSSNCRRSSLRKPTVAAEAQPQQPRRDSRKLPTINMLATTESPPSLPTATTSGAISDARQCGQCTHCLRIMSLTAAGLLHSHGRGCPGSGRLPVAGSITGVTSLSSHGTQQSRASSDLTNTGLTTAPVQSPTDIMELLCQRRCRVLKRVPKASRIPAADKLSETLRHVVDDPDSSAKWIDLLSFTFGCFGVPEKRGGKRFLSSLATKVNQAIASFPAVSYSAPLTATQSRKQSSTRRSSCNELAARVSSKLEEGDIRGAIRLAASEDTIAPFDDVTAEALREKHPVRAPSDCLPTPPSKEEESIQLTDTDIRSTIKSFAPGSAGGPDGLRPQHLKDLTTASAGEAGQRLLVQLTKFTNLCLLGRVPVEIQPIFCGASLCALNKQNGGIRPIAVGSTLRRLVAKAACKAVSSKMAERFLPIQLGFGVPKATEAAAHAARCYVANLQTGQGLLKLDFCNAFNTLSRDAMLETVRQELPELYSFIFLCYGNSSLLTFGEHLLSSEEGAQQGDPLGPLLFCVSTLKLARNMTSQFNLWYLDDGSLGGDLSNLLLDLNTVKHIGPTLGLRLNEDKCEIITNDVNVVESLRNVMPNIRHIRCCEAELLGVPIGDKPGVDSVLLNKLAVFQRLATRLTSLCAHDALFLLKNCFSTPKLLYTLRCAPCYQSAILTQYDDAIKQTLQVIINVDLSEAVWGQATLPVSSGGLGVRLATDLALPAFLSSVAGSAKLAMRLLPSHLHGESGLQDPLYLGACIEWHTQSNAVVPDMEKIGTQKVWDSSLVSRKFEGMLSAALTQVGRARLIAAAASHSGDFLQAMPCSSLGTRLDDTSLRLAVALRLGANMCAPHTCVCGEQVDSSGTHGLACRKSAGRHMRHNAVNDLIKKALSSANIPSLLEPNSLCRNDGKRPDGLTVLPWANGRCLVWDFTCPHTLAASHLHKAVIGPGAVANDAETRKSTKYSSLSALYRFVPIAVETLGVPGDEALAFFRDLGKRIADVTDEPRSFQFLMQRVSVAIQRGNAACIVGTVPSSAGWDELFYL